MNRKVMIVWGILVIGTLLSFLALGLMTERENKDYVMLENELVEASKLYLSHEKIVLGKNDSYEIDIKELKKNGFVNELKVHNDVCKGSILAKSISGKKSYIPHIKCGKYQSIEK